MSQNIRGSSWGGVSVRAVGVGVLVGAGACPSASGSVVLLGQSRGVSVTATADAPGVAGLASQSAQQGSNEPGEFFFTRHVVAEEGGLVAIGRSEQSSIVAPTYIGGHSLVELYAGATPSGGLAGASSANLMEVTFEVDRPTEVVFAGQVGMDGFASIHLRSQGATLALVQGSFAQGEFRGTLEAGVYFVSATMDFGVVSAGGPERFGFDRWEFQLVVVPCPAGASVLVAGGVLRRRRRAAGAAG